MRLRTYDQRVDGRSQSASTGVDIDRRTTMSTFVDIASGIAASLGETGDTLASEARFRTDDMRILERLAGHPLSLGLAGFAGGAMLFFVQHPLPL